MRLSVGMNGLQAVVLGVCEGWGVEMDPVSGEQGPALRGGGGSRGDCGL